MEILTKVNAKRQKLKVELAAKQTIYRYINGDTHRRCRPKKRGRKKVLAKGDVRKIDQARRRLTKKASSQERVTWAQIYIAFGFKKKVSQRSVEQAVRAMGVRFRPPRKKTFIAKDDAKVRLAMCKRWALKTARYWTHNVHVYKDEKAWPLPLTEKQREQYRQSRQSVTSARLRKARRLGSPSLAPNILSSGCHQ